METFHIMEQDWDYLIVLDACRYDYFSMFHNIFFQGTLKKIESPGTCTPEWCNKTFTKTYPDVVYISANPHITSQHKSKFNASNKFHKVVDVWHDGWSELRGTVYPRIVNFYFFKTLGNLPNKRYIIHYLQPHAPYLSEKYSTVGYQTPNLSEKNPLTGIQESSNQSKFKHIKRIYVIFFFDYVIHYLSFIFKISFYIIVDSVFVLQKIVVCLVNF